jgi:beta-lactamase regulating signal transducer with metallopeptidase domain/HEAT repeat protein
MTSLSQILSTGLAERIGWTLLHSLWQFALLAALTAGVMEVLRRRSANLRYVVGCFALAAMLTTGIATFCLLPTASAPVAEQQFIASAKGDPALAVDTNSSAPLEIAGGNGDNGVLLSPRERNAKIESPHAEREEYVSLGFLDAIGARLSPWLPWITAVWIAGVILLSLRNLVGWLGVQRLRRVGTAPVCQELADHARALVARMKISRPVRILQSTLIEIPIVAGWLKPVILLPVSLLGGLSPAQLEAILAHELAHIRRHDYLVNLLQTVAETLLFYHPAVWWVSRRIRTEREHCCDDAAVRVCGNNLGLGEALTLLEASRLTLRPAMAASGGRSGGTLRRVRRLLDPKAESIGFSKASAAVVVLALLGLALTIGWGRLATAENGATTAVESVASLAVNSEKKTISQRYIAGGMTDTDTDTDGNATGDASAAPKDAAKKEQPSQPPQRATLKVVVDLPGAVQGNEQRVVGSRADPAGPDVWLKIELKTREMKGHRDVAAFVQNRSVVNPGEVVFENLPPGTYDFYRSKIFFLGDVGNGAMCDRQDVTLLPGESKTIRLVRKSGQRVAGAIHGLPKDVPGAFITIRPAEYSGLPQKKDQWKLPTYDCLTCQNDANFLTGVLVPGDYKILAHAYRPEPKTGVNHSGLRAPDFVGMTWVTVGYDDPANPKKRPPHVTIEMTPRDEKAAGPVLRGQVLNHDGKPVEDADVFFRCVAGLAKSGAWLSVVDGRIVYFSPMHDTFRTGKDGRFALARGGSDVDASTVVVLAPHANAWMTPAPKEGSKEEFIIRLPQPAALRVIVDIPGAVQPNEQQTVQKAGVSVDPAGNKVWCRLNLKNREMEGWKVGANISYVRTAANPGELVFENLMPGTYEFKRTKAFFLRHSEDMQYGSFGQEFDLDRQDITLVPGKTATIRLEQKRGQRIGGAIRGLPDDVLGTFITVRPIEIADSPWNQPVVNFRGSRYQRYLKLPTYDAMTAQSGGEFLTALLKPGQYRIIAEAHRGWREGAWYSGFYSPLFVGFHGADFTGTALVTIEDDDPVNPKKTAPRVTIEMKPRYREPVGENELEASLDFPSDPPEYLQFWKPSPSVTEKSLQQMIAAKGLRNICTEDRESKRYHVFRKDGENVTVTFKDGKCVGVQRMRKEAAYADRLFNGLGKAAASLQVTVRAEKKVWRAGEDIALKADVRNAGQEDVAIYIDGNNNWQIELDGQWYRSDTRTTAFAYLIGPGVRVQDILVPPKWTRPLAWFAVSDDDPLRQHTPRGKQLVLQPGRHTVRVAVVPVLDSGPYGHKSSIPSESGKSLRWASPIQWNPNKPIRAISNAIEIEVQPAAAAPAPGLQPRSGTSLATVLPPGATMAARAAAMTEKIDHAEVRRKIVALAQPDETAPYDQQAANWLANRRDRIVPELIAGLNDKNANIAEGCLNVLKFASHRKELTDALVAKASDEASPLRYEILRQLEQSAADPRVARLLDRASEQKFEPVARARWAWLSGHKQRAVAILKPMFEGIACHTFSHMEAIPLLQDIGGPDAARLLESIASGDNWSLAVEAYKALAKIDADKHRLTTDQATLLDGQHGFKESLEQYNERVAGLAKLNRTDIRPFVMQMLRDKTNAGPRMALSILAAWRDKESLPQIREFLRDKRGYFRQEAVSACLSIDDSPAMEKGVLEMLSRNEAIGNDSVVHGIVLAAIPVDRKAAMLRAAGGRVSSPWLVPLTVGVLQRRDSDLRDLLVPLMDGETNLQALAGYCELAAKDKEKRFGPQVRRALTMLCKDPRILADGAGMDLNVVVAGVSILQAVAAYDLKDAAPEIEKLTTSKNAAIKAAAQAAGAKLGLPGTVSKVIAELGGEHPFVRQQAAKALLDIKPASETERAACEDAILAHLGKPSEDGAMRTLVKFGGEKAVAALLPILDDANAQRAVYAACVLAHLPDKAAAQKALRRVAIFGLFHCQSYQQGTGIDFEIAPGWSFHQVTMRLNPGGYSGEGPVRIPNELLQPFPWAKPEQQFAVRCYRLVEAGAGVAGFSLESHFLSAGSMGMRPGAVPDATQLPLLREIVARDSHIKRMMIRGQATAHFEYRQIAAKAIAAITKEKTTYCGLAGETLDSDAFPQPYKDQNRLLAKLIVDRIEKAKLPRKPQTTPEWDQVSRVRSMIGELCQEFDPPPGTQLLGVLQNEAKQRKIDLSGILPSGVR